MLGNTRKEYFIGMVCKLQRVPYENNGTGYRYRTKAGAVQYHVAMVEYIFFQESKIPGILICNGDCPL